MLRQVEIFAASVEKYNSQALVNSGELFRQIADIEKPQLPFNFVVWYHQARVLHVESTVALQED